MSNMENMNRVCVQPEQQPLSPPPAAATLPAPAPVSDLLPPPPLQQQQQQLQKSEHQAQLPMEQSEQYVSNQGQPGDQLGSAYVGQQSAFQQRQVFIK